MSSQEAAWIIIKLHDERRHSPRSQAQVLSKHRHNPYPTRARSKTITGQTRQAAVCTQNGNNDTDARDTRASPQKEGTPEAVGTTRSTLTVSGVGNRTGLLPCPSQRTTAAQPPLSHPPSHHPSCRCLAAAARRAGRAVARPAACRPTRPRVPHGYATYCTTCARAQLRHAAWKLREHTRRVPTTAVALLGQRCSSGGSVGSAVASARRVTTA